MKTFSKAVLGLAASAALCLPSVAALAEDSNYVPLFTYRTGPFATSGLGIADGMHDYLTLLNERDGGIGGVKLNVEECETGFDTKKVLECYEQVKAKKAVIINPWSTAASLQLIPKAAGDKLPILTMAYGLSAAAIGNSFPWAFNPPDTYLDGLSMIVKYIASQEGGFRKLQGKKIGYLYLDLGFGREPLPLLDQLSKAYGFETKLYPVALADMKNQASQWAKVTADKPDYMIMWGWGAIQGAAIKEAVKVNYPMEKFISIWWPNEEDALGGGKGVIGFKTLNWHGASDDFDVIKDIRKYVVDKGMSKSKKEDVGSLMYNRGVYNAMLISEAIRNAQKLSGKKLVTGEDVRRGLESLNVDAVRLKALGMDRFTGPVKLSCTDHNGHRPAFVQKWDGTRFVKVSEWISPLADKVLPLLQADAKAFTDKNAPWPARTEVCDPRS